MEVDLARLIVAHIKTDKEDDQMYKWKNAIENIKEKIQNYSFNNISNFIF